MANNLPQCGRADPAPGGPPVHRSMFAVNIVAFGRIDSALHRQLRSALYRIVQAGCRFADLDWAACRHEDRGDGLLVVVPAGVGAEVLLGPLAIGMRNELRQHNAIANQAAQLRLRLAVDAGYVQADEHGLGGRTIIHLFRLLDADAFKSTISSYQAEMAMVTSNYLWEELVRHAPGVLDPAAFMPIIVDVKETTGLAWVRLSRSPVLTRPGGRTAMDSGLDPYEILISLLIAAGYTPEQIAEQVSNRLAIDTRGAGSTKL